MALFKSIFRPESRLFLILLSACLLVRLVYIYATGFTATPDGDGGCYVEAARYITKGVYPPQLPITRPPLYPLLLAAAWSGSGPNLPLIRIFQAFLDTIACALIAWIGINLGNRKTGILAAIIYSASPYFVFDTARIHTETLYQFLVVLAAFLLIRSTKTHRPAKSWFIAGIVLGLSALTRPQALLLIILLAALYTIVIRPGGIKTAAWLLIGAFLTIAPWTLRNFLQYKELTVVTDGGGYTFWLGNNRALLDKFQTVEYSDFLKIDRRVYDEDSAKLRTPVENGTPRERDAYWFHQGILAIRELGPDYPKLLLYKLGVYFRPTVSPQAYGLKTSVAFLIFPGTILMIGFFTFLASLRKPGENLVLVIFTLCCFLTGLAVAILFQSQLRLRVPQLDPLLLLFGSWKLSRLVS